MKVEIGQYADVLTYRSYEGSAEISLSDNCLYGKLIGVSDLVSYGGKTVKDLKLAFAKAVDDYIETKSTLIIEPKQLPESKK